MKDRIENIVKDKIRVDEKIGEVSSGSGHLSQIDFYIEKIHEPVRTSNGWKIEYEYIVRITTEFTYYPDNPPIEYKYKKFIVISEDGNIINESEKTTSV